MNERITAYVKATGSYLPERILTNDELATMMDTSDEWIYTHTGIHNRRIAAPDQAASDLAVLAAQACLADAARQGEATDPAEIDLVLVATATPDYLGFPSTAAIVQDRIGAKRAGAMDLAAACTGFIYALETARSFIEAGSARQVLVIGTEVFSRIVNWKDRGTSVLFGDGAGAVLVAGDTTGAHGGFSRSYLRSDGSGAAHLARLAGGTRMPFEPGQVPGDDQFVSMNGRQVYVFAVGAIVETVGTLLEAAGLGIDAVDHIIPHQANRRILEAAWKRSGWPEDKLRTNMDEYANTSAASIPIVIDELNRQGRLKRGERVLTVGFGAGLTYGGNLFTW